MLTFRPYKNCDAEAIATWITDEKMFYQWSADIIGKYPMAPEHLNEHYGKQINNVNFMTFTACDETAKPSSSAVGASGAAQRTAFTGCSDCRNDGRSTCFH